MLENTLGIWVHEGRQCVYHNACKLTDFLQTQQVLTSAHLSRIRAYDDSGLKVIWTPR